MQASLGTVEIHVRFSPLVGLCYASCVVIWMISLTLLHVDMLSQSVGAFLRYLLVHVESQEAHSSNLFRHQHFLVSSCGHTGMFQPPAVLASAL